MEDQFVLQRVSVAYTTADGVKPIIVDLDLTIQAGELIVIVGPNGSGKSTLSHVLAGLSPISRGTLITSGVDRDDIQVVFQNPDAQIVGDTVYEDVCFGLENHCIPSDEMEIRVRQALSDVGLDHMIRQSVETLSGGQKQLLCIADAIALDPKVLIFDEATAMLDPIARDHILHIVDTLNKRGTTILWVTQLLNEIGHFQRILALNDGKLIFDGTPNVFFYDRTEFGETPCAQLGLVPPYSVQVVQYLLQMGMQFDKLPILMNSLKDVITEKCLLL